MKRERVKTKVPTWKRPARTAYELLGRVCKVIQVEPKRYDQGTFQSSQDQRTVCETAFCVGGWLVFLHDGKFIGGSIEDRASVLLGMDGLYYNGLNPWDLFTTMVPGVTCREMDASGDIIDLDQDLPNQGTPAYAKAGVAHTRRFMKKYEAHLKARLLAGV